MNPLHDALRSSLDFVHHHTLAVLATAGSMAGGVLAGLLAADPGGPVRTHVWVWYMVGADTFLLAGVAIRAFRQTRVNADLRHDLDLARGANEDLSKRVGVLEGIATERGWRLELMIRSAEVLRDRTIVLRDCDEELDRRLTPIEGKLQLARDRAVARLALRGPVFENDLAAHSLTPTPVAGSQPISDHAEHLAQPPGPTK